MASSKNKRKSSSKNQKIKSQPKTDSNTGRLDIVFSGPLLFVLDPREQYISELDVYGPQNDHPLGTVFLPGVFFTNEELNHVDPPNWPEPSAFSLLDAHSYSIEVTQAGNPPPFDASDIPGDNLKIKPGRKLSSAWDVAISVYGKLTNWTSHLPLSVTDDLLSGSDAPRTDTVSCMHRLTYRGVTDAEFNGIATAQKEYLHTHAAGGGTLIVMGEIPYQPTLHHERMAIESLAKLAGLDLHYVGTANPRPAPGRLMMQRNNPCGCTIIICRGGK